MSIQLELHGAYVNSSLEKVGKCNELLYNILFFGDIWNTELASCTPNLSSWTRMKTIWPSTYRKLVLLETLYPRWATSHKQPWSSNRHWTNILSLSSSSSFLVLVGYLKWVIYVLLMPIEYECLKSCHVFITFRSIYHARPFIPG